MKPEISSNIQAEYVQNPYEIGGMSMAENMELQQELDCELINIIVKVPKDTVACRFIVKMLQDGKLIEAHMDMSPEEFRQARQDFCDNVEGGDDYDKMWVLTEKGKAEVDKLMGVDI